MRVIASIYLILAGADALRVDIGRWSAKRGETYSLNAVNSDWIADLSPKLKLNSVQLASIGQEDIRGVVCSQPYDNRVPIVQVPAHLALEVTNNRPPTPFPDFVPQPLWEKSLWFHRLAFKLLYERFVERMEEKQRWFDQLPSSFSTPLHWQPSLLQELQYPSLADKVAEQKEDLKQFYRDWAALSASASRAVSFEQFVWAVECVSSRAFSGVYEGSNARDRQLLLAFISTLTVVWPALHLGSLEQALSAGIIAAASMVVRDLIFAKVGTLKRYVMCPVIDMFNHNSLCQSDVAYDYFSNSFTLTTQGGYQTGEQVFINYGKQSNDRLLQVYGFVETSNPYDLYDFGVPIFDVLLSAEGEKIIGTVPLPPAPSPEQRLRLLADALENTDFDDATFGGEKTGASSLQYVSTSVRVYRTAIARPSSTASKRMLDHVDDVTVRVIRGLYATEEEWSRLWRDRGDVTLDRLAAPLSECTERNVNAFLSRMIENALSLMPTTIEDDEKLLISRKSGEESKGFKSKASKPSSPVSEDPSGAFSNALFAAISFRIEKKRLLIELMSSYRDD